LTGNYLAGMYDYSGAIGASLGADTVPGQQRQKHGGCMCKAAPVGLNRRYLVILNRHGRLMVIVRSDSYSGGRPTNSESSSIFGKLVVDAPSRSNLSHPSGRCRKGHRRKQPAT